MLDYFSVNLRKNEGFLTSIPRIHIPEYSQSNAPSHLHSLSVPGSQIVGKAKKTGCEKRVSFVFRKHLFSPSRPPGVLEHATLHQ